MMMIFITGVLVWINDVIVYLLRFNWTLRLSKSSLVYHTSDLKGMMFIW